MQFYCAQIDLLPQKLRDPDDELVLEAALNGGAEAIVTHNVRDFLPVTALHGLEVLTPGSIIKERFGL